MRATHLYTALVAAVLCLASASPVRAQSAEIEGEGLPLEPARSATFTATRGTWISLDVSPDGQTIVFTSLRDGDLDIYAMDSDGSNVRRLTDELGYDGGPFFSYDGSKIVYRAYHPKTAEEEADYLRLLEQEMIRPSQLDIYVMDADGSNKRQLTDNGAANFAPYFFPDGMRIMFVSNMHESGSRNFDLYMINIDGTGLERVTYHEEFDGFPMFNSDGSKLVWASNRFNADPGDTNIFVANWID